MLASLHRDPRSPYYFVAFTLPNGKRAFRSTKETNRKKAERIALQWEEASKLAKRGELTEAASRKVLDAIRATVGDGALPTVTVRSFFQNWLDGKKLSQKASTGRRYEKPVAAFLESLGMRADKSLAHLTPSDIQNFRDVRTRTGISAATVSFDMQVVRGVLAVATKQSLILSNPALAIDSPRIKRQERDVFSLADIRALLAEANQDWQIAILLGFYLGARLGDATSLTWNEVDLSEGLIAYVPGKTGGAKIEIPLHPDLESHLLKIAGDKVGPLCPSLSGRPTSGRSGLSTQFADLMVKAGIDRQQVQSSKNRKFSGVSFHSMRHSFASALANARISADVRMKLTGHKSLGIHQGYTHVELKGLREAVDALPRLLP